MAESPAATASEPADPDLHFTSEQRLRDGVVEREFTLGEVPGILWTPLSTPARLILIGYPGGLASMYQRSAGPERR